MVKTGGLLASGDSGAGVVLWHIGSTASRDAAFFQRSSATNLSFSVASDPFRILAGIERDGRDADNAKISPSTVSANSFSTDRIDTNISSPWKVSTFTKSR